MKSISLILIENILDCEYSISADRIVGLYPYGSLTYGTQTETSDRDYVVVVEMGPDYLQHETEDVDIHILSTDYFKTLLNKHDIMALEAYFNQLPIIEYEIDFKLDLVKLRHSISAVVSNSWVKARKKMELTNENNYIGIKSCFHALRIAEMGTLIATKSTYAIINNKSLWDEVYKFAEECDFEWSEISARYKPILNDRMTKFRNVAPKNNS